MSTKSRKATSSKKKSNKKPKEEIIDEDNLIEDEEVKTKKKKKKVDVSEEDVLESLDLEKIVEDADRDEEEVPHRSKKTEKPSKDEERSAKKTVEAPKMQPKFHNTQPKPIDATTPIGELNTEEVLQYLIQTDGKITNMTHILSTLFRVEDIIKCLIQMGEKNLNSNLKFGATELLDSLTNRNNFSRSRYGSKRNSYPSTRGRDYIPRGRGGRGYQQPQPPPRENYQQFETSGWLPQDYRPRGPRQATAEPDLRNNRDMQRGTMTNERMREDIQI